MTTFSSQEAVEQALDSLVNQTLVVDGNVTFACDVSLPAGMIVAGDLTCQNLEALDLEVTGNIYSSGNIRAADLRAGNITARNLTCRDLAARHVTLNGNLAGHLCRAENLSAGRVSVSTLLVAGRVVASEIRAQGDMIADEINCSGDITYRGVAVTYHELRCRTISPTMTGGKHFSLLKQIVETGVK